MKDRNSLKRELFTMHKAFYCLCFQNRLLWFCKLKNKWWKKCIRLTCGGLFPRVELHFLPNWFHRKCTDLVVNHKMLCSKTRIKSWKTWWNDSKMNFCEMCFILPMLRFDWNDDKSCNFIFSLTFLLNGNSTGFAILQFFTQRTNC